MADSQAPHTVELFDPSNPVTPRVELAANFDPHLHVRWEARPAVAELDFAAVEVDEKPLLTNQAQHQLKEAGLVNIKAILGGGLEALRAAGVRGKVADDLLTWVSGRNAAQHALAEIAAERAAGAPAPVVPAAPPTTTGPGKPPETGGGEGEAGAAG